MARILLGVSGGIAAYKAVELVRLATGAGHSVRVVQTEAAERFVGRATFEGITGAPVLVDEFEPDPVRGAYPGDPAPDHSPISHLELVRRADVYAIAPASANTLAKLAAGIADNLLTAAALASEAPLVIAPAMNDRMWSHTATRANVETLRARGATILPPGTGALASRGEWGAGRLAEPPEILAAIEEALRAGPFAPRSLDGLRLLVTAGGTREPLDSVRFVGNRSSGRMGVALAEEARRRGAAVTLLAANLAVPPPVGVETIATPTVADLAREALDLPPVIEETIASLRPLAERKGVELRLGAVSPTAWADPSRLRQILNNLLSNAIKFTPEGGRVSVDAEQHGDRVAISVTDTGVGIAPADQHRVFEEFQQVGDRMSRDAGTGLGLALTRRLVEAHGGHIELWSQPGQGSRFTVYLPFVAPIPGTGEQPELAPPDPGQLTILIVEDDPGAQHLLRTYLNAAGYHVIAAPTGEQGLQLAREIRPAAVLLDILLPGIDGWEVLRQLKADQHLAGVPVFMATVIDEPEVGLANGATDYFVKPVDRHRLLTRLAQQLLPVATNPRGARALAIDHDREVLALIEAALRERGFEVIGTTSGQEALRLAHTEPIDLIVSDLALSDLDGFMLVKALSEDPATCNIPVLVLSGGPNGRSAERTPLGVRPADGIITDQLQRQLAGLSRPAPGAR